MEEWTRSVPEWVLVAVEADRDEDRYIITAGHCLPRLPPCHAASYTEERTYGS
jgi:hypothetical protein